MKLKTLLLGSAGALAVAGGAQAADLSVAEPVEYVKVCDAFGAGYWYIPGTDTCLKIGGYVRFDANFFSQKDVYEGTGIHSATWEFATEAKVTVTANSMTEYGPLTGFIALVGRSDNNTPVVNKNDYREGKGLVFVDEAYLSLGPLLVGRTGSIYDYTGGFTYDGYSYDADAAADQVRLTWAMSGFGVMLAIEDPRDRWGTDLSATYHMPNIIAAVTAAQGHWDAKLSVGWAETTSGTGFGAQIATTIKLDELAKGDKLMLKAAWAQGQVGAWADAPTAVYANGSSVWSVVASFQHFWTGQLSTAITAGYTDRPLTTSAGFGDIWQVRANLVWAPVTGFAAGIEGSYVKSQTGTLSPGIWSAKVRLQRSW